MKKLKIILSFILVLCLFSFSGCKNSNNNQNTNNSSNTEQTQTDDSVEETTAVDILRLSYQKLINEFTVKSFMGNTFINNGGKNHYDTFVSQAFNILKVAYETENLPLNTALTGTTIETLDENSNELNKVRYFYVSSEKNGNNFDISLVTVISKTKFYENPLNFALVKLSLSYNTKTNELDFVCDVENSFSNANYNGEQTQSRADYFHFNYSSQFEMYDGIYFHRNSRFNYQNLDAYTLANINNYSYVSFNFLTMTRTDNESNMYVSIEQNAELLQSVILNVEQFNSEYLSKIDEENETENLSETVILLISEIFS